MKILLLVLTIALCYNSEAQKFTISFPPGSKVYELGEIPMTVIIEGVNCDNTVINCHKGLVSMIDRCNYIYRCSKVGVDTIDVFIRRREKLHKIGTKIIDVHPRPLPEAQVGSSNDRYIDKDELKVQQGVAGHWFAGGVNHWESCTIQSFNFIILRNNKVIKDIYNEGNIFNSDVKASMNELESGDHVLIANITGCKERGGGDLKSLEFIVH